MAAYAKLNRPAALFLKSQGEEKKKKTQRGRTPRIDTRIYTRALEAKTGFTPDGTPRMQERAAITHLHRIASHRSK